MAPYPVLIIGCGSIGERHLRCFQATGRAAPTACDTSPALLARMAETYGVKTFADLDAALAAGPLYAAVICTPAPTHIPIALKCLRAGLHVLIEKPLSTNLDGTDALLAGVDGSGRFAAVAYVYHAIPAAVAARAFLQSGALGRPLHATIVAGQHFPTFRPAYRDIYYNNHATGGGAIQDALTHLINATEWLLDAPTTRLFCDADHLALEGVTVEDTVHLAARNGDIMVSYAMNQHQAPNETTIAIHCEGGSLAIELHRQQWKTMARGEADWTLHPAPSPDRDYPFTAQANAFLDGTEGKPSSLCTVPEAIHTLKVNLAALESARTGRVVDLP